MIDKRLSKFRFSQSFLAKVLYKKICNLTSLNKYIDKDYLEELSILQFKRCKEIFPSGANLAIANKIIDKGKREEDESLYCSEEKV